MPHILNLWAISSINFRGKETASEMSKLVEKKNPSPRNILLLQTSFPKKYKMATVGHIRLFAV